MALIDDATFVVGGGSYYTADTGTALPDELDDIDPGDWEEIGHTSLDEILNMESEGGEATILGTLQNRSLRTRYSDRTDSFNIVLQQFDEPALKLYFGANAPTLPNGMVGVTDSPQPTICAFLAVFTDGDKTFALWAPRAEIFRSDAFSVDDTENLMGLPLKITPLRASGNNFTYGVTPLSGN